MTLHLLMLSALFQQTFTLSWQPGTNRLDLPNPTVMYQIWSSDSVDGPYKIEGLTRTNEYQVFYNGADKYFYVRALNTLGQTSH